MACQQQGIHSYPQLGRQVQMRIVEGHAAEAVGSPDEMKFDAVCVCSGLHEVCMLPSPGLRTSPPPPDYVVPLEQVPHVPAIEGAASFDGTVLHSAEYKDRELFRGKRCS